MSATRASATAVTAVLGGVLLVIVLVTWAASIGPSGILTGEGPAAQRSTPTQTATTALPFETPTTTDQQRLEDQYAGDRPVLRAIALVLEVAAALLVLFLLYRGARWARQVYDARRRPPPEPDEVEFDVLETPRRIAEEMTRDAVTQRRLLLDGSPRNGIVECWHRFEQQAADAGFERRPWETSSEFTLRMLDLVEADSHAVARLAVLYREARFSDHPLGDEVRDRAVAALDAIHAGLLSGRRGRP